MRILVGCEYSGTVRDAFLALGHDAMSCDLLPTDAPGPHYEGDVRDVLGDGWDLAIFHPECTYLCRAGQRWLHAPDDDRPGKLKGAPRYDAMWRAVDFFRMLQEAPIERVAIENPRPNSEVIPLIGKPDQFVHPWMFGHPENKGTGLWLKNLPPLVATDDMRAAMAELPKSVTDRIHRLSPSADRWKIRSTTFPGLAAAMASQWAGELQAKDAAA